MAGQATSASINAVSTELYAHQKECSARYKAIEEKLDSGNVKSVRLENMIWGLYVILIASTLLPIG